MRLRDGCRVPQRRDQDDAVRPRRIERPQVGRLDDQSVRKLRQRHATSRDIAELLGHRTQCRHSSRDAGAESESHLHHHDQQEQGDAERERPAPRTPDRRSRRDRHRRLGLELRGRHDGRFWFRRHRRLGDGLRMIRDQFDVDRFERRGGRIERECNTDARWIDRSFHTGRIERAARKQRRTDEVHRIGTGCRGLDDRFRSHDLDGNGPLVDLRGYGRRRSVVLGGFGGAQVDERVERLVTHAAAHLTAGRLQLAQRHAKHRSAVRAPRVHGHGRRLSGACPRGIPSPLPPAAPRIPRAAGRLRERSRPGR